MIDSIYIAMTGLSGYQKGLQVISNDSANLNTPGFKGSSLQFSDMFYSGNASGGNQGAGQYGSGLNTLGTVINFAQGQFQSTGNDLDLALDGTGFFVLKDKDGNMHYTRDGQFKFDKDNMLVSSVTGEQVMALDAGNKFVPISIANSKYNHNCLRK
jgi:flagellar hook protein FlgE